MITPPESECHECGEWVSSVYDHADDCPAAKRMAQRHIERLEDTIGTVWETESGTEQLEKLRSEFGDTELEQ